MDGFMIRKIKPFNFSKCEVYNDILELWKELSEYFISFENYFERYQFKCSAFRDNYGDIQALVRLLGTIIKDIDNCLWDFIDKDDYEKYCLYYEQPCEVGNANQEEGR